MNDKAVHAAAEAQSQQVGFENVLIRPGDAVQVHLAEIEQRCMSRYIGHVTGKSVLLEAPVANNQVLHLRENQTVSVRAFSGTSAYAFNSQVTKAYSAPLPYLHLAWPRSVRAVSIRGAARVDFSITARVVNASLNAPLSHDIVITDLSITGAAFHAEKPVGKRDDELIIRFSANLHNVDVEPVLPCVIRSVNPTSDGHIKYGVQFTDLSLLDTLTLQGLVCMHAVRN